MSEVPRSPLDLLEALAMQEVAITPNLAHLEIYTMRGLLTLFWHGPRDATNVVLCAGGGMGGLLGPAGGLYHDLGCTFAEQGIGVVRVDYRNPNDLSRSVHDVAAAGDLASRSGARQFVVLGHSFGGAVAVQTGAVFGDHCKGVVTFATQSAGCEHASELKAPLLMFHGTNDTILPPETSNVVQMIAGQGEIVMLEGDDHLLSQSHDLMREHLLVWIPAHF